MNISLLNFFDLVKKIIPIIIILIILIIVIIINLGVCIYMYRWGKKKYIYILVAEISDIKYVYIWKMNGLTNFFFF